MNIGACRKTDSGVMCPSYMATREEQHTTRGRANALVKALSTPDPRAALGDQRLHEIMDLCLECKACKSECPLSVDMASLKSEFLSHYQQIHGTPLRSRAFGAIRLLNRVGAATAPLSNLPGRVPLLRRALDAPARHRRSATASPLRARHIDQVVRAARHAGRAVSARRGRLPRRLVHDVHRAGHRAGLRGAARARGLACAAPEPGLLRASKPVQGAARPGSFDGRCAGREPRSLRCAGRPDRGLRTLVRADAARRVPGPAPGRPARAHRGRPGAAGPRAAGARRSTTGTFACDPASALAGRRIVLHAHCHEKAVTGTRATLELLRRIPGASVEEIDAGCCGMAGSFGFESEHYELSMQIGALRLSPSLAAEDADVLVAATGVSCRQQIAHGTRTSGPASGRAGAHGGHLSHRRAPHGPASGRSAGALKPAPQG